MLKVSNTFHNQFYSNLVLKNKSETTFLGQSDRQVNFTGSNPLKQNIFSGNEVVAAKLLGLMNGGNSNLTIGHIHNPKIAGMTVEGKYSLFDIKRLEMLCNELKQNGYFPSGHALKRMFERSISADTVIDVIKANQSRPSPHGTTFVKDGIIVGMGKENQKIIATVIDKDESML